MIDGEKHIVNTAGTLAGLAPSFAELVALNAGVVLEPLASPLPVEQLDDIVVTGIAGLPKELVSNIISGHSEPPETALLHGRFKDIRQWSRAAQTAGPLVVSEPVRSGRRRRAEIRRPDLAQAVQAILFDCQDRQPNLVGLPELTTKRASSPTTIPTIIRVFRDNGYDLSEPAYSKLGDRVQDSIFEGYDQYLINNARRHNRNQGLQRLIGEWTPCLAETENGLELDMQEGVLCKFIWTINYDSPEAVVSTAKALFEGARKLNGRLNGDEVRLTALLSLPLAALRIAFKDLPPKIATKAHQRLESYYLKRARADRGIKPGSQEGQSTLWRLIELGTVALSAAETTQ